MTHQIFDEWYDVFIDHVRGNGYTGPVDKHSFETDYEDGKDPYHAAIEFVKEMKE